MQLCHKELARSSQTVANWRLFFLQAAVLIVMYHSFVTGGYANKASLSLGSALIC